MARPFLVSRAEVRRVIAASSAGTVFEWYDFYLYAVLAPFFAKLFFPPDNETAALLAAFATYAAGFMVRPLGAVVLGRLGDLAGRKYTFLISIVIMGFATFTVGLLPTFDQLGWISPILLVILRLIQGFALGGEYGGAATYVAEYTEGSRRGYATGWVQTTATLGLLLALLVIGACRVLLTPRGVRGLGMAAALPCVDCPSAYLDIYPRQLARDARIPDHESGRPLVENSGMGELLPVAE